MCFTDLNFHLICFFREMEVYAPYEDQPNIRRSRDELPDNEKPIYDAFMDPEFVKKFVSFLALEENKGKDKFRHKYLTLFKVGSDREVLYSII